MSQKTTKKATRATAPRWRMRRGRAWLAFAGVLLALLATLLLWAHPRVLALAEQERITLGARLESDLQVERIRLRGLTLAIEGLSLWPQGRPTGTPLLEIESLTLRPGWGALRAPWRRDALLAHAQVQVHRPRLWIVEAEGWSDLRWLREQERALRGPGASRSAPAEGMAEGVPSRRALPHVVLAEGWVSVEERRARWPSWGARVPEVALVPSADGWRVEGVLDVEALGRLVLEGEVGGGNARIALTPQEAQELAGVLEELMPGSGRGRLRFGSVHIEGGRGLRVRDVALRQLDAPVPGAPTLRLRALSMEEIAVEIGPRGVLVEAAQGEVRLAGREGSGRTLDVEALVLELPSGGSGRRLTFRVREGEAEAAFDVQLDGRSRPQGLALRLHDMEVAGIAEHVVLPGGGRLLAGRLDGELYWRRGPQVERGNASLAVREGRALIAWIAAREMEGMDFSWEGEWERSVEDGSWHLEPARVEVGGVGLRVRASRRVEVLQSGDRGERWLATGRLEMVEAAALQAALPRGFSPILAGLDLSGRIALELDMDIVPAEPDRSRFDLFLREEGLGLGDDGVMQALRGLAGGTFRADLAAIGRPDVVIGPREPGWPDLEVLPQHVWRAVLAAEDDRFALHAGFDLRALRTAIAVNLLERDVVRGASTISQQVVKNLFTGGARSVARKLEEVVLTWALEEHVSKERILQLYLALMHVGPDLWGIDAGARAYFGVPATQLRVTEAIFIASILGSPERWGVAWLVGELEASRWEKMRNVLRNLERAGVVGPQTAAQVRTRIAAESVSDRGPLLRRLSPELRARVEERAAAAGP